MVAAAPRTRGAANAERQLFKDIIVEFLEVTEATYDTSKIKQALDHAGVFTFPDVGWVERSDTHRGGRMLVGIASLNPPYGGVS